MVVCHSNIHGGNLLKSNDGQLYLLDWENAMIAPPEHDLMFFAGEPGFFESFYPINSHHVTSSRINLKLLEFYFYRRALEDLADFILRINSRTGTPERDSEDLHECLGILDGLPKIEKTVAKIRKISS